MSSILGLVKRVFNTFSTAEDKKDDIDLSTHPIFDEMRLWQILKSGNLNIKSPAKKNVSMAYLNIFFKNMDKTLNELVSVECGDENTDIIKDKLLNMLHEIQSESIQAGIPQIFIDKINISNYKYFDMIFESVQSICDSSLHASYESRLVSILDIILFYIKVMTDNVESTINEMNGHLESALKGTVFDIF